MSFAPYWRAEYGLARMSSAEIIEGRSMRIRRDETSSDEVLRAHVEAAKGANGGPLHIHLRQEERFIVDRGMLLVRRGRERIHVGPGEDVRIPAKVRHTFEAEVDSTYTAEFRPALRVEEFFRDLFALPTDKRGNPRIGDAARLMRAYPDEFLYFPFIPVSLQRTLAVPLSKLGTASQ
jgi:mannose-6-phosphate isomerase-like protein (cupin superfamily)